MRALTQLKNQQLKLGAMVRIIASMGAKNSRFIPGIYNYCDYWCERCGFTQRCRNFAMGQELEREVRKEARPKNATNAAFWNHLAEQAREAGMKAQAPEWVPELPEDEDPADVAACQEQEERRERTVRGHTLVRLAYQYMDLVGAWLNAADGDLKAFAGSLLAAAGNRFDDTDYEEQAREIGELIDVVAWYHTLLPPKVSRIIDALQDCRLGAVGEVRLDDAHGTGKLVLVSIDRSIAAWVQLREILPQREDEILALLALLSRLQRGVHAALPGARAHARPGLDAATG